MAEINLQAITGQLKNGLVEIAKTSLADYLKNATGDIDVLLNELQEDLQTWAQQLVNGEITSGDLEFLLKEKKDLLKLAGLKQAGLTQIKIDEFKSAATDLIFKTLTGLIK